MDEKIKSLFKRGGVSTILNRGYRHLQTLVAECIYPSIRSTTLVVLRYIAFKLDPFWIHLSYFLFFPFLGYLALKFLMPSTTADGFVLEDFDIFFTSMSAMTESSLSSVEMEVFSTQQLMVLIILMFCGGEVFTSMIGLLLRRFKFTKLAAPKHHDDHTDGGGTMMSNQVIELIRTLPPRITNTPAADDDNHQLGGDANNYIIVELTKEISRLPQHPISPSSTPDNSSYNQTLKHESVKSLSRVLFIYLTATHVISYLLISLYISLSPSAIEIIKSKSLSIQTFSMFLTVSTLSNCGFLPNNENMAAFKSNSGLQLILLPQIFLGNSLHPCCLRLVIWVLERLSKREDYNYILNNYDDMGYAHLMSPFNSRMLGLTTVGFVVLQFGLIGAVEWRSENVVGDGRNSLQKVVGFLFQAANTRHSGESIFDLSLFSPAVLVLIVVMMYLPPYIMFIPRKKTAQDKANNKDRMRKLHPTRSVIQKYLIFSPLSFLAIFIIVICIIERNSFKQDPLNFNVFTVVFEVISAYGNVGYSMGYSCKKRLTFDPSCEDATYGFVGRWTKSGKFVIIVVMLFGRLKRFSMQGGRAWHLR